MILVLLTAWVLCATAQHTTPQGCGFSPTASDKTTPNCYQWVIDSLATNAPTLQMLQKQLQADEAANNAGSFFDNPELEVALYTSRPDVGPRHDIRLTQRVEFPLYYIHRNRIRKLQNDIARSNYQSHRTEWIKEVQQVCSHIVYYNAYVSLYAHCVDNTRKVANIYEKRLRQGDCSVLDYNRMQTELAAVGNKLHMAQVEHALMADNLLMLAGGMNIELKQDTFAAVLLPTNFEEWLSEVKRRTPTLQMLEQESIAAAESLTLSKLAWLPALTVGYAAELSPDDKYHGIAAGIALPLWQRQGTVREARLAQQASQAALADAQTRFEGRMRALYTKASALQKTLADLSATLQRHNSEELLLRALEAGAIPLEYYLQPVEFYHDTEIYILEIQHELEETVIELLCYTF